MSNRTSDSPAIQLELPFDGTFQIPLGKGHIAIVDVEDADLARVRWYPANKDGRIYAWRKVGEYNEKGQRRTEHLHRVIFERIIGRSLETRELVDHQDNDPLNNRRSNLRLASKITNAQNSKKQAGKRSQFKGVTASLGKWEAAITVNKHRMRLGRYDTEEEAYEIYCEAARKYFGEFARLD